MNHVIPIAFFALGLSTTAAADDKNGRVYFQLDGGRAQFADSEINGRDVEFDEGWSVNLRAGKENGAFATEFEVGLHGANYEPLGDGYSPALFLTAGINLIYRFLRLPGLDAYVALGGGYLSNDPPISFLQVNAHAEGGLVVGPDAFPQLVPHVRAIAIFGAWQDDIGRAGNYSQYITTARLGLRF